MRLDLSLRARSVTLTNYIKLAGGQSSIAEVQEARGSNSKVLYITFASCRNLP